MIYFTADTHFDHTNIIKHCNRPFSNVKEMNELLIENWNAVVPETATIYHMGDFVWWKSSVDRIKYFCKKLNGNIELIYGNHDDEKKLIKAGLVGRDLKTIKFEKQKIMLSHYSMRVWNASHFGSWNLYGHSHGSLPEMKALSFDVGVDANYFTPLSFIEVKAKMDLKRKQLEEEGVEICVGKKSKPIKNSWNYQKKN